MDEMRIESAFMRGVISKLFRAALKKKLDCNISIELYDFEASVEDGKMHIHLDADLDLEKEELMKLLKSIGC